MLRNAMSNERIRHCGDLVAPPHPWCFQVGSRSFLYNRLHRNTMRTEARKKKRTHDDKCGSKKTRVSKGKEQHEQHTRVIRKQGTETRKCSETMSRQCNCNHSKSVSRSVPSLTCDGPGLGWRGLINVVILVQAWPGPGRPMRQAQIENR